MKRIALFLVCLIIIVGTNESCFATIQQLTNNTNEDSLPSLYDGTVAWYSTHTLNYWDGTAITQLGYINDKPSVYNGAIAWSDGNIKLWNGTSIVQVTNNYNLGLSNSQPSLYNGTIAWTELNSNGSSIYYWNGVTAQLVATNLAWSPSNYNGTIAYENRTDGSVGEQIFYWNGTNTIQITNNTSSNRDASLYNGTIAWDNRTDGNIYYWDGTNTINLTQTGYSTGNWNPSLYDSKIAWSGFDGQYFQIYYWDGTSVFQLTNSTYNNDLPSLFNGTISWVGGTGVNAEIYYWNGDYADLSQPHPPISVPEPSTMLLFSLGLIGLIGTRRRIGN